MDKTVKINPVLIALVLVGGAGVVGGGTLIGSKIIENNSKKSSSSFVESSNDGNKSSFSSSSDESIQNVASKLSPSVVSIIGVSQKSSSRSYLYGYGSQQTSTAGTGVIVTKDGYILTNKHVVEGVSKFQIVLADGTTYENVKVAATDPLNDIAYLKISGVSDLTPAELGDSKTLSIGQEVIAIGNALGEYQGTVTSGIISGVNRSVTASSSDSSETENLTDMIQTDAAINSGNSGGPLVNAKGQVIGINTAVASDANGIGFAIPISATKGMLKSLVSNGSASRSALGVSYIALTPAISKENNLSSKSGAWIHSEDGSSAIKSGGSADKAGVKNGDIITAVNGVKIGSAGSVSSLISEYSAGENVKLTVLRNGQEIELTATLSAYSAN